MADDSQRPLFIEEHARLHPVDLADRLRRASDSKRVKLLNNLPIEIAAAALAELHEDQFEKITEGLSQERVVELVGELPHDDAADILGELEEERREQMLKALPDEVSVRIEELLRYPEDTAGGIMSDRFITLTPEERVSECQERLRQQVMRREGVAERFVETLVVAVSQIPHDPHLAALVRSDDYFTLSSLLKLSFVQEEMVALSEGDLSLTERERDELSELLLRLLHSFLADPGQARSEKELRRFLRKWLVPMIDGML